MNASRTATFALRARPRGRAAQWRRGVATLWLILLLPVLLILLCLVVEIGNLWLARMELEDGLEAGALAAVKEWGDTGGVVGTLPAREMGREFARANSVRGEEIVIDLNHAPLNVNGNAALAGPTANLVFGAVTSIDPTVVFDANVEPSCGAGTVLVDATGSGNLSADNAWGVSFHSTTVPGLLIDQVIIDLTASGLVFSGGFTLSDNAAPHKVSDNCPMGMGGQQTQPDNVGVTAADFVASLSMLGQVLTIDFTAPGTTGGLNPGTPDPNDTFSTFEVLDQFRFGHEVLDGANQADADDVALAGATITIVFSNGDMTTEPLFDNLDPSNQCYQCALMSPVGLIVHPTNIPDLPCAETSANPMGGGNGQSYVLLNGGAAGANLFAVRASAEVEVQTLCGALFGASFGPFTVSAETTAVYDCMERCPKIIRVDTILP